MPLAASVCMGLACIRPGEVPLGRSGRDAGGGQARGSEGKRGEGRQRRGVRVCRGDHDVGLLRFRPGEGLLGYGDGDGGCGGAWELSGRQSGGGVKRRPGILGLRRACAGGTASARLTGCMLGVGSKRRAFRGLQVAVAAGGRVKAGAAMAPGTGSRAWQLGARLPKVRDKGPRGARTYEGDTVRTGGWELRVGTTAPCRV